ncbi:MAG: S1 RNA-binding domain-containing protein [Pirellulaceae bacterium]|nr:S1 RNA-binding domain-containing protein [Pirellulaceae bacterium]
MSDEKKLTDSPESAQKKVETTSSEAISTTTPTEQNQPASENQTGENTPEEISQATVKIGSQRKKEETFAAKQSEKKGLTIPAEQEEPLGALSDDLEKEIEAALGDASIDDLLAAEKKASELQLEPDTRHKAQVIKFDKENVFVNLGGQNEGFVPRKYFEKIPAAGDNIDVVIKQYSENEQLFEVGLPNTSTEVGDWSDLREGVVVETIVTGSNTGGLEAKVNNIRGFIPASHVSIGHVEKFGDYVGQKLQCVVLEVSETKNKLVLSHRAILEREREVERTKLMATLEVGQEHEGVVRKLMDFGAFVDIGGTDGLIHISQLSWDRIKHPGEVLSEGQKVKVKILKMDPNSGKISLAYRNEGENPWKDVEAKYPAGSLHNGTVTRATTFGAFVKLEPGVEGLVHISELAHHRVLKVTNVVQINQEVEVKVLQIDGDKQQISLSIKAASPEPSNKSKKDEVEEEYVAQTTVKPIAGNLKGGIGRDSGGDKFGLKW